MPAVGGMCFLSKVISDTSLLGLRLLFLPIYFLVLHIARFIIHFSLSSTLLSDTNFCSSVIYFLLTEFFQIPENNCFFVVLLTLSARMEPPAAVMLVFDEAKAASFRIMEFQREVGVMTSVISCYCRLLKR